MTQSRYYCHVISIIVTMTSFAQETRRSKIVSRATVEALLQVLTTHGMQWF